MRSFTCIVLAVALLSMTACDEDDNYYDYLEYSYIDSVLVADTIQNDELALVVHVYPVGCNYFERIESRERGDTLKLAVLYHFYFRGMPCAHGSGLDTTLYSLHFSASGQHYLSYRRSEGMGIVQPVYVR
jgi:hypothetical protein